MPPADLDSAGRLLDDRHGVARQPRVAYNGAVDSALQPGRDAFARRDWAEAFTQLRAHEPLCQDDLERFAVAAHLVGQPGASELAWEQAHRLAVQDGDADRAARCAFWLGFDLLLRGESACASGWLARAERVAGAAPDGATRGLLLLPRFLHELHGGDVGVALDLAEQLAAIGQARADADLLAFGLLCQGEARPGARPGGRRHAPPRRGDGVDHDW